MDEDIIRQVVSVGDLIDTELINNIKIDRLDKKATEELKIKNKYIGIMISILSPVFDETKMNKYKQALRLLLEKQWDVLDECYRKNISDNEKGYWALKAQLMNEERVKLKNAINDLTGFSKEVKKYGK
tara:strand:+ start:148 stop:531 length:384 start_codon:yes stop_codon:yes gene_type:complete